MVYGELNGHVTDLTWSRKIKLMTSIRLEPNITRKQLLATIA